MGATPGSADRVPGRRQGAGPPRLSSLASQAWRDSFLGQLPDPVGAQLLLRASESVLPVGHSLSTTRQGEESWLMLVASGLVRVYMANETRQVTVRYVGAGQVVGLPAALRGGRMVAGQVLIESHVVRLDPKRLRHLVETNIGAAHAVLLELIRLHDDVVDLATATVFLPVRQRVARHLLELAVLEPTVTDSGSRMRVHASQQAIADSVASVREVVSRVLSQFRSERVIAREGSDVVIIDPAALHVIAAESH